MSRTHDLSKKTVFITGGDKGIGLSIAKAFRSAGGNVAICARDRARVRAVSIEFEFLGIECDIRSQESIEYAIKDVINSFGKVDILVNCAGITCFGEIQHLSAANWKNTLDTNLGGAFFFSQAIAKHMVDNKKGRIINISSIKASFPEFAFVGYSVSKAGINALTRGMALELAQHGITVNAICPGYVDSGHIPQEHYPKLITEVPQKRILQPEEIANIALFLASEESCGITGQIIEVAGGLGLGSMGDESQRISIRKDE